MEFRHLQCKAKGSAEAALLDLTKTLIILLKTKSVYNQAISCNTDQISIFKDF